MGVEPMLTDALMKKPRHRRRLAEEVINFAKIL
jgi:hypothetical protein